MLTNNLSSEIRSKRRGLLSKYLVLLHDNARSYIAVHAVETLQKLNFEVLAHPPYSPDLGPLDYYLFRGSQRSIKEPYIYLGLSSERNGEFLAHSLTKTLFYEGFRNLVPRWTRESIFSKKTAQSSSGPKLPNQHHLRQGCAIPRGNAVEKQHKAEILSRKYLTNS
ncbi:NR6A1 [Cordylochernes scorpioides]|uniref:NR6A1 n=1 Tax=Cordylochernes scorpioides TaxID=51811 RepID=A0ABY6L3W8_9ARAC|nr:NR6A1 [Cordylochernes scorpioides]